MKALNITFAAYVAAFIAILAVIILVEGCNYPATATANATEIEYWAEDNYCLAPAEGIQFQDLQLNNDTPYFNLKPCVLTEQACNVMARLLYKDLTEYPYPFAAVAYDCGTYYLVDID